MIDTSHIDSGVSNGECALLASLAAKCPQGAIVEIGSWKGKSAVWIGTAARERGLKVYAVDSFHDPRYQQSSYFDEFWGNITKAGLQNTVVPIKELSLIAAKKFIEPIALIFIDGDHDYKVVKQDFADWYPKVMEGGWVAFHDSIGYTGVRKVIMEEVFKKRTLQQIGFRRSIIYGCKSSHDSQLDALLRGVARIMLSVKAAVVYSKHAYGQHRARSQSKLHVQ